MNTMIKSIIVEDSEANRDTLRNLLQSECPQVNLIGEAPTLEEAEKLIEKLQPDLVFLDIQMKKGTSFDLLARLHEQGKVNFEIIFVTAYGMFEFATKAIEYAALDFITKPVEPEKLASAVKKASEKIAKQQRSDQIALLLDHISRPDKKSGRIAFHLPKGVIEFVEVEQILKLEADGTISYVYLTDGRKINAMKNLGQYSKLLLADHNFFQVSNSVLVNLDYVKRYNHSELTLTLTDGSHVFASRRGGQDFKKYLNENQGSMGNMDKSGISGFLKNLFGK